MPYHIPALLHETIDSLELRADGCYADLTFGGGGHSRAIMERLSAGGTLYSFDQDIEAYHNAMNDPFWREKEGHGWQFVHGNFRYLRQYLDYYQNDKKSPTSIDGILADLGVSFHHFDDSHRGFSFRFEGPLDMRMNQQGGKTAADILNSYTEEELANILYLYGELRQSRRIASAIVRSRATRPIERTTDLLDIVAKGKYKTTGNDEIEVEPDLKKDLSRLFQALRIEVNDELGALRDMLVAGTAVLRPGGVFAILTYHSLEDRMVKNFFRTGNIEGVVEKDFYGNALTPFAGKQQLFTASADEVERNPRARSAKLRVAQKR
ncbi:MAG: 16S rRNA (cytosine(1402)-N(4))-methyltransferase RsmH [Paludibacteraceae bacterium]|nr:16S rRNA (cytosine(1402)-N(4))-methyltransferase RsmH [Paludibacteraceae bacterium]